MLILECDNIDSNIIVDVKTDISIIISIPVVGLIRISSICQSDTMT